MWERRPTLNDVLMFPGMQPFLAFHEQFGDGGGGINSDYNNSFGHNNDTYNNDNNNYSNITCRSYNDFNRYMYYNNNMHYNCNSLFSSNNIEYNNNNIPYYNNHLYYNNNNIDYNTYNEHNYNNNNYNNNDNDYNTHYYNTNVTYPIPLEFSQHSQEAPRERMEQPFDDSVNVNPSCDPSSGGDAGDEGLLLIPHRTGDTIYYVASPASPRMHSETDQESPGRTDGPHREFHVVRRSQMYDINGVPIIAETGLLLTVTVWTMAMADVRRNDRVTGWLHVVTAVENGYVTRLRQGLLDMETHENRGSDHNEELLLYGEAIPVFG